MKRNISVFILLILIASSFKYRSKFRENDQQLVTAGYSSASALEKTIVPASLPAAIIQLEKANREYVNGNPKLLKSLWEHSEEVTIFDGVENQERKGWKAIEAKLNTAHARLNSDVGYSFKKIATDEGDDQAYLLQEESYKLPGDRTINLHVTILFRKINNTWKIVHRHEDILSRHSEPDKSSK
jgi:hypothetical protein